MAKMQERIDQIKSGDNFQKGDLAVESLKKNVGGFFSGLNNGLGAINRAFLGAVITDVEDVTKHPDGFWKGLGAKIMGNLQIAGNAVMGVINKAGEMLASGYQSVTEFLGQKRDDAHEALTKKNNEVRMGIVEGNGARIRNGIAGQLANSEANRLSEDPQLAEAQRGVLADCFAVAQTGLIQYGNDLKGQVALGTKSAKEAAAELNAENREFRTEARLLLAFAETQARLMDRQIAKGGDRDALMEDFRQKLAKEWEQMRRNNVSTPADGGVPAVVADVVNVDTTRVS